MLICLECPDCGHKWTRPNDALPTFCPECDLEGIKVKGDAVEAPAALTALTVNEGRALLILCPGYWGKGVTPAEALMNIPGSLDRHWRAWDVDASGWVNDLGQIVQDKDRAAPTKLASSF